MLLSLNQVSKGFLDETVLNDINLSIQEGDHIGLLGVNGVGKTTLLNILTGTLPYDSGVISTKKDLSIGYLKQNESLNSQNTLEEEIHLALQEVYTVREQLAEISAKMASTAPDSPAYLELTNAYEELSNQYAALDGYHADVRIQTVLNGLGFGKFRLDGKISTLSGGEKIRFAMAKVLLQNPELLILDEPTNHLDFSMLTWLEEYLTAYKGAVVVVSHDRYFLNRVASDICELERGTLYRYKGGYSAFLVQKEERIRALEKEYKKQPCAYRARLFFFLFHFHRIGSAVHDLGHIHAGSRIHVTLIERPVLTAVLIFVNLTVDGLHIQTVRAILALQQTVRHQRITHELLVGLDGGGHFLAVHIHHREGEGLAARAQRFTAADHGLAVRYCRSASRRNQRHSRNQHRAKDERQPFSEAVFHHCILLILYVLPRRVSGPRRLTERYRWDIPAWHCPFRLLRSLQWLVPACGGG